MPSTLRNMQPLVDTVSQGRCRGSSWGLERAWVHQYLDFVLNKFQTEVIGAGQGGALADRRDMQIAALSSVASILRGKTNQVGELSGITTDSTSNAASSDCVHLLSWQSRWYTSARNSHRARSRKSMHLVNTGVTFVMRKVAIGDTSVRNVPHSLSANCFNEAARSGTTFLPSSHRYPKEAGAKIHTGDLGQKDSLSRGAKFRVISVVLREEIAELAGSASRKSIKMPSALGAASGQALAAIPSRCGEGGIGRGACPMPIRRQIWTVTGRSESLFGATCLWLRAYGVNDTGAYPSARPPSLAAHLLPSSASCSILSRLGPSHLC